MPMYYNTLNLYYHNILHFYNTGRSSHTALKRVVHDRQLYVWIMHIHNYSHYKCAYHIKYTDVDASKSMPVAIRILDMKWVTSSKKLISTNGLSIFAHTAVITSRWSNIIYYFCYNMWYFFVFFSNAAVYCTYNIFAFIYNIRRRCNYRRPSNYSSSKKRNRQVRSTPTNSW